MFVIRISDKLDPDYPRFVGCSFIYDGASYPTWEEAYSGMLGFAQTGPTDLVYAVEEITQEQWDELQRIKASEVDDDHQQQDDPADWWKK
jgi:hypothetical protein